MIKAFQHLVDFCEELFPDAEMSIYVPPSNLMSEEGKKMILEHFKSTLTSEQFPKASDVGYTLKNVHASTKER